MSSPFQSFRPQESQEDLVIRLTTETLMVHVASRAERPENAPLNEQDRARLRLLGDLAQGPHRETVIHLIKAAFPEFGTKRVTVPPAEGEA